MRGFYGFLFVFVIACPAATLQIQRGFADDFQLKSRSLFDGQTLAGWEGNAYWFRIEDDAIVAGRLDQPIPHNEFLCTTELFADFELRLEAKLIAASEESATSLNAGVQFRTKRIPHDSEVSGYQADMGKMGERLIWGGLYDESRRNRFLVEPPSDLTKDLVKENDWNEIRIRCQGPRIQIFVNGVQTVDYTETDDQIPRHGILGLQIHGGPAAEAHYRNLRIRNLISK
ncbi:hypothetical protein Pla52o_04720 [Novipirellula galeiformis]|uniref:3-keto-alpha-glucoside-1,2-lyase/3-keto-2-hydroxy-glucal hydratase domain-containing protein n=1 Tax=Novipirellula galeiformis TaxID=2528004 RepID=A0A5C6CVA0_9BACT|nr:DUF1080 domain-containing protein [Novipirellula galeiformis]TWU26619.1 hypothetical protein Pla52o_04720 [Novipirellula galeiformis]